MGGSFFIGFLMASPRGSLGSEFAAHTPRLEHRFTLFFLLHPRHVSDLQTGPLFITNGALGGENSSKRSQNNPEEICDPNNTVPF